MSLIDNVDILDESKECFLVYSEEVLTDRAIPAAEDGLLSAQRKLLWTMEDHLKMDSKGKTKKCNAIVGSTLATSYYHGDASCYGVLCKLSQDYLMRYPLIKGQGSLGTQENNDMFASSRYTEAKPSIYADIMMNDFKKNVVPMKETYNGEYMEPVVLPAIFPNAICNGRQAIGISMAHNSAPHNMTEVCNAIIAYINNPQLSIDELLNIMPGPDFPLGGIIINKDDIKTAFATGKSKVSLKIRGDYEVNKQTITFTTIPYRTYRNKIKEQITKNIEELDKVIDDFNDESSIGKNKLVFHVKDGVSISQAVNKLFAYTDLQTTLSYNMNYIVNGTPKLCSMLDLIREYTIHQTNVLLNATHFDRDKADARKHILEGLLIAITDIDAAIALIRESNDRTEAEKKLIARFNITPVQAKAVLDMKLAKLTKLDKDDLLDELKDKVRIIQECDKIINDEAYRNTILINKITDMRNKYGDTRRTQLMQIDIKPEEKEIATVEPVDCVVTVSESGLIKRIPTKSFKVQKRNGIGVKNNDDIAAFTCKTNTIDVLLVFTAAGKMYRILVDNIPEGTNAVKGTPISTLISFDPGDKPKAYASLHRGTSAKFVLFSTKNGLIKKVPITEYENMKRTGIKALTLKDGDEVADVTFIEDEDIILVTNGGMTIHFPASDLPISSRIAQGVKGINLAENDYVVACLPIHNAEDTLAVVSADGLGKKTVLKEFPAQSRGGKGLKVGKGNIVGACLINDDDKILISGDKSTICIAATDIPLQGRITAGNALIKNNRVKEICKV